MEDEEKERSNMGNIPRYKRTPGTDASHGHKFEMDLFTLAHLRCMKLVRESEETKISGMKYFSLANNVQNIGAFDDIVVKVEYIEEGITKTKLIFVQCKHVANTKKSETRFEKYMNDKNQIKKWFESYVRIRNILTNEYVDEGLLDKVKTKRLKLDLHNIQRQEIYELKKVFNCDFSDCEFVFISNINSEVDQISQTYEFCESTNVCPDYSSKILKTTEDDGYEVRLKHFALKEFGSNILIKEFCDKFRLILNQNDRLEFFINKEIELCTQSIRDADTIRHTFMSELHLHFNSSEYCELITEKSEILRHVKCLVDLKCKSAEIIDQCRRASLLGLFSKEAVHDLSNNLKPKEVLDVLTNSPKIEKLKIIQFVMSENKECLLLFLSNEEDLSNWTSARKSNIYKTFSTAYIFSEPFSNISPLHENEIFIQVFEEEKQYNYFDQLSEDTQNNVQHSNVCFQGFSMKLSDICRTELLHLLDGNTILKILENEQIEIAEALPKVKFCIQRKFYIEILKEKYMNEFKHNLKPVESGHTYFMFAENYEQDLEKYYQQFETIESMNSYILNTKFEKEKTFHFCCFENGDLQLLFSFGKQGDYTETKQINDKDVLDGHCKITMLAYATEMRKSNTLLSFANKYKHRNQTDWVYFIETNEIEHVLNDDVAKKSSSAVEFISKHILRLKGIEDQLFINACNESGNVALFFDEIAEEEVNTFLSLLKELEKTKIKRIFISTRLNNANILKSHIFSKSITVLPLTDEDSLQFLGNDWNEKLTIDTKQQNLPIINELNKLLLLKEQSLNEMLAIHLEIRKFAENSVEALLPKNSEIPLDSLSFKSDLINSYECFAEDHVYRIILENIEVRRRESINLFSKISAEHCQYLRKPIKLSEEFGLLHFHEPCNMLNRSIVAE